MLAVVWVAIMCLFSEAEILLRTERSIVRAMCGVHHKDRKSYELDAVVGFE